MDRELLARKLYGQRINTLVKDSQVESHTIDELWESKTDPSEAARIIEANLSEFDGPAWLSRYLNKK